jgi:protein-disulfide isomerase
MSNNNLPFIIIVLSFLLFVNITSVNNKNNMLPHTSINKPIVEDSLLKNKSSVNSLMDNKLDFIFGNPNGNQEIIAFIDVTSPACKDSFPVLETLTSLNPNLKVVIKLLPVLSSDSVLASRYLIIANSINPLNAKIFLASLLSSDVPLNPDIIKLYFMSSGFNDTAFDDFTLNKLLDNSNIDNYLYFTRSLATELNVKAIPVFIVNNKIFAGEQNVDYFNKILKESKNVKN